MKLSSKYIIRELAGEKVLMPKSVSSSSVRTALGALRVIALSASASWLFDIFGGQDFTMKQAVDAICGHFDVPRAQVELDLATLIDNLRSCGALED